jgi:cardiolipin synthase
VDVNFGSILREVWPWTVSLAYVVVAVWAASHAIIHKRDVRAAIGWTGLVLFSPFVGAAAYYFFGINRLHRKAVKLTSAKASDAKPSQNLAAPLVRPRFGEHLDRLNYAANLTTGQPLLAGNAVTPLANGDAAYPEMLRAIAGAERSIVLATYIFDVDHAGRMFLDALSEAADRGVQVRVLIDGVGKRYSRPPVTRELLRRGVPHAVFLPTRMPLRNPYMNLRNHRKLLIVDGCVGFAGGLNIREGCLLEQPSAHPVQDVHFRFDGPVVDQMFAEVLDDWYFASGERLQGAAWESSTEPAGDVLARGIPDGPDDHFETIRWTILAALTAARRSVRIASPYFLPDQPLIHVLGLAALRGVEVDILVPEVNNLRFVKWASTAQLWQVLMPGCRVWSTPPPFDHSKVMVVDEAWSLVGSANWDARSLRLNFEFNVECYDETLAGWLMEFTGEKMARGRRITLEEVDARNIPTRLRDGIARLFAPYL